MSGHSAEKGRGRRGPAEQYVRRNAKYRQGVEHHDWSDPLTAALVMTLIDWKVESEARPSFGEGSDCSDLMSLALTRIKGMFSGELDPEDVLNEIDPTEGES